ncbi:MAG: amidohydrolase family protein [Bacteroidota bacterium]
MSKIRFTNAHIIDGKGGHILENSSVTIENNHIVEIGNIPQDTEGLQEVDLQGKYMIPGLWDMHAHVLLPDLMDWQHALLLVNGVTGVRDCGSDPSLAAEYNQQIKSGTKQGPDVSYAGPMLDGAPMLWPDFSVPVNNPEEAAGIVAHLNAAGADFFVAQSLISKDALKALIEFAGKVGKNVTIQNPLAVSWEEASDLGVVSFETLGGMFSALTPDGGSAFKKNLVGAIQAGKIDFSNFNPLAEFFNDREASRVLFHNVPEVEVQAYNSDNAKRLADHLAKNETCFCPQLLLIEDLAMVDKMQTDDLMKYVPQPVIEMWNAGIPWDNLPQRRLDTGRKYLDCAIDFVNILNGAGVKLLAGTHTILPHVYPGFDLHNELFLLTQAGLSNYEALQTATLNATEALRKDNESGTIEIGKKANLVFLEKNPLKDIRNIQSISGVVRNGHYTNETSLSQILISIQQ